MTEEKVSLKRSFQQIQEEEDDYPGSYSPRDPSAGPLLVRPGFSVDQIQAGLINPSCSHMLLSALSAETLVDLPSVSSVIAAAAALAVQGHFHLCPN